MGVTGLWTELRRRGCGVKLQGVEVARFVEGKRLAVDVSVWLYEAQKQRALAEALGPQQAALRLVFERCSRWLRKGVLPIVVLEGTAGGRAHRVTRGGPRAAPLSEELAAPADDLRRFLSAIGVPHVDADGEGEAACASLAATGVCDMAATSDSDALLFGAPAVLRGLHLPADIRKSAAELWIMEDVKHTCGLGREALVVTAALAGCDYSPGIHGVGIKGAFDAAVALETLDRGGALRYLLEAARSGELKGSVEGAVNLAALTRVVKRVHAASGCDAVQRVVDLFTGRPDPAVERLAFAPRPEWSGVAEDAGRALAPVFRADAAAGKLLPLQLEWILRSLRHEDAADVPRVSPDALREWAARSGFQWAPLSARRVASKHLGPGVAGPEAVVRWVPTTPNADDALLAKSRDLRFRASLVEACGLLPAAKAPADATSA